MSNVIPVEYINKMSSLSDIEKDYFRIMWVKYGVLYITSKPGIGKSAIMRDIADKMGFQYIDIRLSMIDEVDIGLYPYLNDVDNKKIISFAIPEWAIKANQRPTIIHFEELNRTSLQVRNAALQILLERQIGSDFLFNNNVLMVSSGNLGEEDGTDVEEFDSALNNRLIHVEHVLTVKEWIKDFANDNCHKIIIDFINSYPDYFYKTNEMDKAYATPRTWTMLSKYIIDIYGIDSTPKDFIEDFKRTYRPCSYVGNAGYKFIEYCQNILSITISYVIDRYDMIKEKLKTYNNARITELVVELKTYNITKLDNNQLKNVYKFLKMLNDEELTSYIVWLLNEFHISDGRVIKMISQFSDILSKIRNYNSNDSKEND